MTFHPIKLPQFFDSSLIPTKEMERQEKAFSGIVRNSLKACLYTERGVLVPSLFGIERIPICPICGKPVKEPSMHEALITRRNAEGLPYELRIQIYVAENCVLLHEGKCHLEAQHTEEGIKKCVEQIIKYRGNNVKDWLDYMNSNAMNLFIEKERYL